MRVTVENAYLNTYNFISKTFNLLQNKVHTIVSDCFNLLKTKKEHSKTLPKITFKENENKGNDIYVFGDIHGDSLFNVPPADGHNSPPADGIYFNEPKNFKPVKTAVGCYIQNDKNEILWLFRDKDQKWCVPGGTLKDKETHLQAIRREVEEETGLKLDIKETDFYGTCYLVDKTFHLAWHIYAYKALAPLKPVLFEPDIHSKCEWMPLNRVKIKECMPGTEECLKFLKSVLQVAEARIA